MQEKEYIAPDTQTLEFAPGGAAILTGSETETSAILNPMNGEIGGFDWEEI